MTDNTNEKPSGVKEQRLALAFGRACSDVDDLCPPWLGMQSVEEQRDAIEWVAKEQGFEIAMFAVSHEVRSPGMTAVLTDLMRFAKDYDISTLFVPSVHYLAGSEKDEYPYHWERVLREAGIEINEAPSEDWLL